MTALTVQGEDDDGDDDADGDRQQSDTHKHTHTTGVLPSLLCGTRWERIV